MTNFQKRPDKKNVQCLRLETFFWPTQKNEKLTGQLVDQRDWPKPTTWTSLKLFASSFPNLYKQSYFKTPKFINCPLYLLSLDINVILQNLHVASSSNEDESSDMESFVFAICFRDLKCAFKLKPYLVSKSHTSQLYLPTALPSISRWVPDILLCCSLLCRSNLKIMKNWEVNVKYRLI